MFDKKEIVGNRTALTLFFAVILLVHPVQATGYHYKHRAQASLFDDLSGIVTKRNAIPIAIIGGGVGGLSAGIYAGRSGINSVVFLGDSPGGQLTTTGFVENLPGVKQKLGSSIMLDLQEQASEQGALIEYQSITKVDLATWPFTLVTSDGDTVYAYSVIVASGSAPRKLSIPGEDTYWARGVSTCAVCDCVCFKNKKVLVVGGGDSALEEAMQLAGHAATVTLLVRSGAMRATKIMQERIQGYSNIDVLYHKEAIEILGNGSKMTGVLLYDNLQKEKSVMQADGLFLAIGHDPNTQLFAPYLELDSHGAIRLDCRTQETNLRGVFAAGDVADSLYRQAGVAAGTGIMAALDAINFLRSHGWTEQVNKKLEFLFYRK